MQIDETRLAESLSLAVSCKTISDPTQRDENEFVKFHDFMKSRYKKTFLMNEYQNVDGGIFIKISGKDSSRPIVLMSHLDVVPENGKWSFDAFSGEIIDGVIRGRGTVDTKCSLIAIFEAVEDFLEHNKILERDLYILSSSREEIAGNDIPKMVEIMKSSKVKPILVVDEGGGIIDPPVPGVRGKFAMIGMIERSSARVVVESDDKTKLEAFKESLKKVTLGKAAFCEVNEEMFKSMIPNMNIFMKFIFKNLKIFKPILLRILPKVNESAKMIIGPTFYLDKPNVNEEPKFCKEQLVYRLSGNYYNKIDDISREFISLAEKADLKAWVSTSRETPQPEPLNSKGYNFVKEIIKDTFNGVEVSPYCILGGTDARHFIGYADSVIRFAPIYMNNQQFSSFHKTDENINISSLVGAVKFYDTLLNRVNKKDFWE